MSRYRFHIESYLFLMLLILYWYQDERSSVSATIINKDSSERNSTSTLNCTVVLNLCAGGGLCVGPCQYGPWGQCGMTRRKEPVGRLKCKSWEQNNYSSHLPSECLVEAMAQQDAAGQEWSFHPAGITRSSWSCQKWQNNMLSPVKGFKHDFSPFLNK